jgi:fatty acid desaturase
MMLHSTRVWQWALLSVVIGHSMFLVGDMGHGIAHRAIIRTPAIRYPIEILCWGILFIPATMWRITHNQFHHRHANARKDAFYSRRLTPSERTPLRTLYLALFQPNRRLVGNPLVLAAFQTYIILNIWITLRSGQTPPENEDGAFTYPISKREKARVVAEIGAIIGIQCALFWLAGDWHRYLFMSPVAVLIAGACSMSYIHTQHIAFPVTEENDPLYNTQSLTLPRWLDWLHGHHSHHVEHHLFPGVSPHYYPAIRKLMKQHYPEEYQCKSFFAAWRELWQRDIYSAEPAPPPLSPSSGP